MPLGAPTFFPMRHIHQQIDSGISLVTQASMATSTARSHRPAGGLSCSFAGALPKAKSCITKSSSKQPKPTPCPLGSLL